ncbi:hypothetical protein ABZ958_03375 [Streptomyces sp. NPDC046237]|uniref:hypothetical protein n=1 Tax=Streptomyces sp. NPDC046237 TaxID=3154914 RepID=UPI0033FC686F
MTPTFDSLIAQYGSRVADIIGSAAPKPVGPESFIAVIRAASGSLDGAYDEQLQEVSDDLTAAADHLADALTKSGTEQELQLARAESRIRVALEFAS